MADPGADTTSGLAAPPPPPPQTEASDAAAAQIGASSRETVVAAHSESHLTAPPVPPSPPPPQTEESDAAAPQTPGAPSRETAVAADDESHLPTPPPLPPPPPPQTEASDAAAPHTPGAPSRETAVAADDESRSPAPPPPPPPPPPQTEESDAAAPQTPGAPSRETAVAADDESHLPTSPPLPPPPPPQTEASDATAPQTPGAPSRETAVAADDESHLPAPPVPPPPPPPQAEASDAAAPQTPGGPSRNTAVAADDESQPPAPPPPPPPQEQRQDDDAVKDGKEINPRQSPWPRVRSPVLWLLSLFRLRRARQLIDQPKIHAPPPQENVPAKEAAAEKNQGEGSKRWHHEALTSAPGRIPPPAPEGSIAGDTPNARLSPIVTKFQKAVRRLKETLAWYHRHSSPVKGDKPADEAVETKPSPSLPEEETAKSTQDKVEETTKKPSTPKKESHPRWPQQEPRLENILEEACTRLVAPEFRKFGNKKKRQCLLTFSVFPLGSEVKKQAVTYWWATQFNQTSEELDDVAYGVFSELCEAGFLKPIKNHCSKGIHGCWVNPLVHWMLKDQARENHSADLDESGDPAVEQPNSAVLCLTKGNRALLQKLHKADEQQNQDRPKLGPSKKASTEPPEAGGPNKSSEDVDIKRENEEKFQAGILLSKLDKKRIILNISAHAYRLPEVMLFNLANQLEVLQLGRWWNSDDDTYMEVHALEKLTAIGKLKNLRYLSLRGLSRLTELPSEVQRLRRLAILDVRGCQNLVKVSSAAVKTLKRLTHLDLTECYMLEHIGRGVTALSELRVFKGFVFGVGKRRGNACRLQDLARLRNLRKLSVNVTTDSNVGKGEMAQLGRLTGLLSLTVTWGELPSILLPHRENDKRLQGLLNRWTDLELPKGLQKLDVRCYPSCVLPSQWFKDRRELKKLYVRGGEVEKLDIPEDNKIQILRLRYLNKFKMGWGVLLAMLNKKEQTIERVEVVDKDQKVMRNERKQSKDGDQPRRKTVDGEEVHRPIKKRMEIPVCTLDGMGVWVRDAKEEENGRHQAPREAPMEDAPKAEAATGVAKVPKVSSKVGDGGGDGGDDAGKARTEVKEGQGGVPEDAEVEGEPPNKEDRGDTAGEVENVDGGDEKGREMVKGEQGNEKKVAEEDGVQARGEKKSASSPALASEGDVEDEAGGHEDATDRSSAPGMVPTTTARNNEADDDDDDDDDDKGAEAEDEPAATEEDRGGAGAVREVVGQGEDVGAGSKVVDQIEERATTGEDGGGGDTDSTISPAARPPELEEATAPLPSAENASASRTKTAPQALPAATGPATAAADEAASGEPKEPGKVGYDGGLKGSGGAATDTTSG